MEKEFKMKPEERQKIRENLEATLRRPAKPHELINMENDALLLAKHLLERVSALEDRVTALEKAQH